MITEDYVSFETAKLLKEKGFDEACDKKYFGDDCSGPSYIRDSWEEGGDVCPMSNSDLDDGSKYADISAPTIQMAMKWLRKAHNIHIEVRITNHSLSSLIDVPRYYWIIFNAKEVKWMDESTAHKPMSYETVEEAYEAAIKHCLKNLI